MPSSSTLHCGRCSTLDVRQRGRPRADTHAVRTDRSSMVPPRPRTPHCTEPSHAPVAAPRTGCSCHALVTTPPTTAPASSGSTTRVAWAPSGKVHLRYVTTGTLHSPPGSPDVASAGPRWLSSGSKQTQVLAKGFLLPGAHESAPPTTALSAVWSGHRPLVCPRPRNCHSRRFLGVRKLGSTENDRYIISCRAPLISNRNVLRGASTIVEIHGSNRYQI